MSLIKNTVIVAAVLSSVAVVGCSDSDSDDHSEVTIESSGRLAIYDTEASALKVFDLEEEIELEAFNLSGAVPRLYPVPGNRYTAVIQRSDNLVSFVDGGLYTEDHGDHLHDYAVAPSLLDYTLSGVKPTHFETHDDNAIVFNDGSEVDVSSVTIFSAVSLANEEVLYELNRENNMHGVAKQIGDQLFVTYRDVSITDTTLPAEVEHYSIDNGLITYVKRYDEQCPRLHGAGYNHDFLVFGCSDGVLAIDLNDEDFNATKFASPAALAAESRIGQVYAHPDVEALVTLGGSQLFALEIQNSVANYTELDLGDGVSSLARGFTPNGEYFWVVTDEANLLLWEANGDWTEAEKLALTNDEVGSIYVTASSSEHVLYVLDVANQRVFSVNYETLNLGTVMDLSFVPSGISWMGLENHEGEDHHDD